MMTERKGNKNKKRIREEAEQNHQLLNNQEKLWQYYFVKFKSDINIHMIQQFKI